MFSLVNKNAFRQEPWEIEELPKVSILESTIFLYLFSQLVRGTKILKKDQTN